jgi:hypothetical protein
LRRILQAGIQAALLSVVPLSAQAAGLIMGKHYYPEDQRYLEQTWPSKFRAQGTCTLTLKGQAHTCRDATFQMVEPGLAGLVLQSDIGRIVIGGYTRFDPDFIDHPDYTASVLNLTLNGVAVDGHEVSPNGTCWIELTPDLQTAAAITCTGTDIDLKVAAAPMAILAPPMGGAIPAQAAIAGCGTLTIEKRTVPCTGIRLVRDRELRYAGLAFETADGPIKLIGPVTVGIQTVTIAVERMVRAGKETGASGPCKLTFRDAGAALTAATCDLSLGSSLSRSLTFAAEAGDHPVEAEKPPLDGRKVLLDRRARR